MNGRNLINTFERFGIIITPVFFVLIAIISLNVGKLNWDKMFKVFLGGALISLIAYGFACLLPGLVDLKVSQWPMVAIMLLLIVSESILYPTMSYIVYRSSPIRFKGLFQGVLYGIALLVTKLITFGLVLGDKLGTTMLFIIFSAILVGCVVGIIIFNRIVNNQEAESLEEKE